MSLATTVRATIARLLGYPVPSGGAIVPDYRPTIIGNPYALPPVALDFPNAYRLVSTVFACVSRKSADMASMPVIIEKEGNNGWEPIQRGKQNIVDIWHAGNPEQTGMEVVRDLHSNYYIHGNAYLLAETYGGRQVKELWVLPSHLVEPIPGDHRGVKSYVYLRGGRREAIPAENVIHWKAFNPDESPIGMSPLEAARMQFETRYDLMRLMQKVVRNGGTVAGYMRVVQPTNGPPVTLTEDEKKAIGLGIRRLRKDPDVPVILDNLQWDRMGLSMQELQVIDNASMSDADICRVLGVPPWLIGIKEGAKLGDSGQSASADERIYWQGLKTELEFRDRMLTEKLVPMFKEANTRFRTDLTAVPALNAPILNAAQQAVSLAGRPVLTVNEVRRMSGLPPYDDPSADELYEAPAPVPFGMPSAPGGQDAPAATDGKDVSPEAGKDNTKPAAEPVAKSRLIDTPERAERWRGKDKLMKRYERQFEREFVSILNGIRKRLMSALESEGLRAFPAKRAIDLDAVFSPDGEDERAIHAIYASLIAERGKEAAAEVALELEVNLKTRQVEEFIKARKTVGLNGALDNFMQSVRMDLADGISKNESLSELAARIATQFDDAEQGRVLTIVRTETVSAYNFATVEAWRQTGDVEKVEWLSARDSAVRDSHAAADGQQVTNGSTFDVGGSSLAFPGDPAGDPSETINCRCTVLPVLSDEARKRRRISDMFSRRTVVYANGAH